MEHELPLDQVTKKGAMTKSPFEMTKSEYFVWQLQNQIDARNNLFAIGQPFVHEKDGIMVAEHADGRVEYIRVMSNIHIIAGPPGVGKSTLGYKFIDEDLDILDEDQMRFKYREQGYPDYNEHAIQRVSNIIRSKLIRNQDFAYELNLGYPEHYDYVLSAKRFNNENKLHVILFHTDDLEMCLERARLRFESGRHLVKPDTIKEMYANTLPLLKKNFESIDHLTLINADSNYIYTVAKYQKADKSFDIVDNNCKWFKEDLAMFIYSRISESKEDDRNRDGRNKGGIER